MLAKLKENLTKSMKARNTLEMGVLRVLISNIQTLEATQGKSLTEDQGISVVKKLINQNNEEIASRTGHEQYVSNIEKLNSENAILATYLPSFLAVEKIKDILSEEGNLSQIKAAKNAGQAIGIAIKLLKPFGAVEGQSVKDIATVLYTD